MSMPPPSIVVGGCRALCCRAVVATPPPSQRPFRPLIPDFACNRVAAPAASNTLTLALTLTRATPGPTADDNHKFLVDRVAALDTGSFAARAEHDGAQIRALAVQAKADAVRHG